MVKFVDHLGDVLPKLAGTAATRLIGFLCDPPSHPDHQSQALSPHTPYSSPPVSPGSKAHKPGAALYLLASQLREMRYYL